MQAGFLDTAFPPDDTVRQIEWIQAGIDRAVVTSAQAVSCDTSRRADSPRAAEPLAAEIKALRMDRDPTVARVVPPHITVV